MSWTQTVTVIGVLGALMVALVGAQAFWIARAIDVLSSRVDRLEDRIDVRLDRIETRLETIEQGLARQGERVRLLEESRP